MVIVISILLGACVCAAFVNVYLDIDSKVSRELKTYGANMIFAPKDMATSDDMSEKTYNEMIAKVPKDSFLARADISCSGKYRSDKCHRYGDKI